MLQGLYYGVSRRKRSLLCMLILGVICTWVLRAFVSQYLVIPTGYKVIETKIPTGYKVIETKIPIQQTIERLLREVKMSNNTSSEHVQFGKVSDYACSGDTCRINGRDINKHLIPEAPNDTFTSLPRTFLKEFKNPCWRGEYNGVERLLCLPYCYLAGFTKSGTTDLSKLLITKSRYIDTHIEKVKEAHYWDRMRRGRGPRMNRKVAQLPLSLLSFAGGSNHSELRHTYSPSGDVLFQGITIDCTPSTVWDNEYWETFHPGHIEPPVTNPDLIHAVTPHAKVIIVMRDPIKRMKSAYEFFCARGVYKCNTPLDGDKFHTLVTAAVNVMKECMVEYSVRACVYNTSNHQLATHLYASVYSVYIKDWLRAFPREQLYITRFEDHIVDQCSSVKSMLRFLDEPPPPHEWPNKEGTVYFSGTKITILPQTEKLLRQFFRPYNLELAQLLGDSKYTWGYEKDLP